MGYENPGARGPSGRKKGQSEIMEYMIMVLLIVAAIIGIILFLTWWGAQQLQIEGFKNRQDRVVSVAQQLMGDYTFADEESMFNDAKLTAANTTPCEELQKVIGEGWYARIKALDMEGNVPCRWDNYPDCNYWEFCGYRKENVNELLTQKFPVNVQRSATDKVALAVLEVGVYT
jgi:hypothetical protein